MTNPTDWVQVLPETSSEDRMHILDDTCWCKPTLAQVPDRGRFSYQLVHRVDERKTP